MNFEPEFENQTSAFLRDVIRQIKMPRMRLKEISVEDESLTISNYSGSAIQLFYKNQRGKVRKYQARLRQDEQEFLTRLLIEQDFLTIQTDDRSGNPGEKRQIIEIQNQKRDRHEIAKWSGDHNERFDVIYSGIRALAELPENRLKFIPNSFAPWQMILAILGLIILLLLPFGAGYLLNQGLLGLFWPSGKLFILGFYTVSWAILPVVFGFLLYQSRFSKFWDEIVKHNVIPLVILSLAYGVVPFILLGIASTSVVDQWGLQNMATVLAINDDEGDWETAANPNRKTLQLEIIDSDRGAGEYVVRTSTAFAAELSPGDEIPVKYLRPDRRILTDYHLNQTGNHQVVGTVLFGTLLFMVLQGMIGRWLIKNVYDRFD